MTSKEIEERSGVPRANIRFYEAEGLLHPQRKKNGYRDYSEADLAELEKIKLMRRLGVGVEDLKALQQGTAALDDVLGRRMLELSGQREMLDRVEKVCGRIRADAPGFDTLDTEKYLQALDAEQPAPPLPAADALPTVCSVSRRLFARVFDWYLTVSILFLLMGAVGYNPVRADDTALFIGVVTVMALTEPLLLWLWGTTPGKVLLGMRLVGPDGERLSYETGLNRHLRMLWGGLGLGIPIWSWVQMYRSVNRCMEGEPQPWDEGIAYTAVPFQRRHLAGFLLAAALLVGGGELANDCFQMPPNRGDLTVAEFAENFNRQAEYMDISFTRILNEEGAWQDRTDTAGTIVVLDFGGDWGEIPFDYTVEDGVVTAVSMSAECRNAQFVSPPMGQMLAAMMAFVWAQQSAPLLGSARGDLLQEVEERGMSSYTLQQAGVTITCQAELEGFMDGDVFSFAQEGQETYASLAFTLSLDN